MTTAEVVQEFAVRFTGGDATELIDGACWALEALRSEMYLRGDRYIGPAQTQSWGEVPTSPENFSDDDKWGMEPDEADYWLSIVFCTATATATATPAPPG